MYVRSKYLYNLYKCNGPIYIYKKVSYMKDEEEDEDEGPLLKYLIISMYGPNLISIQSIRV